MRSAWLIILFPITAFAWSGDGHQIVALIAEERLTPEARAMIRELLGDDVSISDADVALWADNIRRERRETAPWHYVNIPTSQPAYDVARDGKDGENVIDAIGRFERVLSDKAKPREERAEALKFIVHFVGDIHQPLHCVDRNGDRGGNGQLVFFLDRQRAASLHQCWDSLILIKHKDGARVFDYAQALNAKITTDQVKLWEASTRVDWANEGHRVAIESVYKDVPADGDPPKLDQAYVDRAGPVIDVQLQKAGVRLAIMLNRALTD